MRDNINLEDQDLSIKEIARIIELDPDVDSVADFEAATSRAIAGLLDINGLVFPCHLSTLARNGWASIIRYTEDGECVTLTEHQEGQILHLPIHCLFMDSKGFTARVIVRQKPRGN